MSLFVLLSFFLFAAGFFLLHEQLWDSVFIQYFKQVKLLKNIVYKFTLLRNLDNRTLLQLMILNIIFYLCFLFQFAILVIAFYGPAPLLTALWGGNLMYFAKSLIPAITLGEVGIREMTSMYFVAQFGIPSAAGFSAAFSLFLFNIAFPSFIGMLLFYKKPNDN